MLFEESGIILAPGEQVVMQGRCSGVIPVGMAIQGSMNPTTLQEKAVQKPITGELVLTNQRGFVLARQGLIQKAIEMYKLNIVGATVRKPLFGKEKLGLLLDVGEPQAQRGEMDVDNAAEWVNKIREVVSGAHERTTDSGNLLGAGLSAEATTSENETFPQGSKTTDSAVGDVRRICSVCGGTGRQTIMQMKTVWEAQTVYEQVTEYQFGKPVRVTRPRVVTKPVQKPDPKIVVCYACGGTGRV